MIPTLPATGCLFGANMPFGRDGATTRDESRLAWETAVGRPAAVHRLYHQWFDVFPDPYELSLKGTGQVPVISWGVSTYTTALLPFRDIAAGLQDAVIDARAADVKAYGAPIFLTFDHEPEGTHGGTAAEFVAAWRRIHDRFRAAGVTNVSWVPILTAAHYRADPDLYYPGDSYVDLVGADGYNWYGCPGRNDPWRPFAQVFDAFHTYAISKGKPMLIGEWASTEDHAVAGRKAAWITDAAATLKAWPEVKVVTWYDNGPPRAQCDWWIGTSASSLAAFKAIANDPYFNPVTKPDEVTVGYVGGSITRLAAAGYQAVGGRRMWPDLAAYGGGTVDEWASSTSRYWTVFDDARRRQPADVIWWQLGMNDERLAALTRGLNQAAHDVVAIIARRCPGIPIEVSGQAAYPDATCRKVSPATYTAVQKVTAEMVADRHAKAGPMMPALFRQHVVSDGCHQNAAGQALHGRVLKAHYG